MVIERKGTIKKGIVKNQSPFINQKIENITPKENKIFDSISIGNFSLKSISNLLSLLSVPIIWWFLADTKEGMLRSSSNLFGATVPL